MPDEPASNGTAEMRERVLAAARECVGRYGIAKTAMEDIAKVAGVSRPTVYRYLGDRNSFILTLVMERARAFVAEIHQVVEAQETFEDKIIEGILRAVDLSRNDPYLGVLVSQENIDLAARAIATEETVNLNVEVWTPVLSAARASGVLRPELDLRKVCEWLSQVAFIMVGRSETIPRSRCGQRSMLRAFLLPTLIPDQLRTTC